MTVKIYARFYISGKDCSIFTEKIPTIYIKIKDGHFEIKCPGFLVNMINGSMPNKIELIYKHYSNDGSLIEEEVIDSFLYLDELSSRSLIKMDINF